MIPSFQNIFHLRNYKLLTPHSFIFCTLKPSLSRWDSLLRNIKEQCSSFAKLSIFSSFPHKFFPSQEMLGLKRALMLGLKEFIYQTHQAFLFYSTVYKHSHLPETFKRKHGSLKRGSIVRKHQWNLASDQGENMVWETDNTLTMTDRSIVLHCILEVRTHTRNKTSWKQWKKKMISQLNLKENVKHFKC